GDVDASLVAEYAPPDERLPVVGTDVGEFADEAGELGQTAQLLAVNDFVPHLQLQVRDDLHQVRVAAAFPVPVDRPLHVPGAAAHAGEGIGDAQPGVVVRVDADRDVESAAHELRDLFNLVRQAAAVRVAQDEDGR